MKEDIDNLKWHVQHLSTTDKKGNKVFTADAYSKVMELVEILNKHIVNVPSGTVCDTEVSEDCKKCLTHQCNGCTAYDG